MHSKSKGKDLSDNESFAKSSSMGCQSGVAASATAMRRLASKAQ